MMLPSEIPLILFVSVVVLVLASFPEKFHRPRSLGVQHLSLADGLPFLLADGSEFKLADCGQ